MNRPLLTIKRRTAAMAWLLAGLLLVLPAGHHAAAGLLVCFGMDGHIEVEDGRWSDCATNGAVDLHFADSAVPQDAGDDCGDCFDVPLMANPADGRVAVVKTTMPLPDLALTAVAALVDPAAIGRQPDEARPHRPPPSASPVGLRTVVLRV